MGHQISSTNAQRPQAMFAETESDHGAADRRPPGQAKKHHHADFDTPTETRTESHSQGADAAENSQGSPDDANLIGWLKNKLGPMLAAVQQRDAQGSKAPVPTEEDIKQQVAVAAAVLVSDNQLWSQHKQLDTAALKNIVAHPSQFAPSTVKAAQTMLDHLTYFSQAGKHDDRDDHDVHDDHDDHGHRHGHRHGHDHADAEVRRQDLIKLAKSLVGDEAMHKLTDADDKETARFQALALAAVAARAAQQASALPPVDEVAERAQVAAARQVLQADASLWPGKTSLSVHDLQDILKNSTQHSPETVHAGLYLLQHPAASANVPLSASETDATVQSVKNSIVAKADKNALAGVDDDDDDDDEDEDDRNRA